MVQVGGWRKDLVKLPAWRSMQVDEIELREGEGRWEKGEKPKAMVVLKEETKAKEVVLKENEVMNEEMKHNRRLERVAIKP